MLLKRQNISKISKHENLLVYHFVKFVTPFSKCNTIECLFFAVRFVNNALYRHHLRANHLPIAGPFSALLSLLPAEVGMREQLWLLHSRLFQQR